MERRISPLLNPNVVIPNRNRIRPVAPFEIGENQTQPLPPIKGSNPTSNSKGRLPTAQKTLRIGVVGYSGQRFNEDRAVHLIQLAFDTVTANANASRIDVVSGLTDLGIPALAYREAARRGWRTVGIACSRASECTCYPVDQRILIGQQWGDESTTFLNTIDCLIRIGGGQQAQAETQAALEQQKQVLEYDLSAQ